MLGPLAGAAGGAVATPAFAVLVAVAAAAETARLTSPRARAALERLAGGLFRDTEAYVPSGASLLALGYAITWWLFASSTAEAAIAVAAVADPAAAVVGTRLGAGSGKSLAGSVACAIAAAVMLWVFGIAPLGIVVGAVGAAAAERAPWRGADNITVPLVVAALARWLR